MAQYLIHFNQQWVGDHSEAWFQGRGPLARAVVEEMRTAGVLVFAGGLIEEIERAVGVEVTDNGVSFTEGPLRPGEDFIGGLTIVEAPDDATARIWAGKVAAACGWPQEVRRFKP